MCKSGNAAFDKYKQQSAEAGAKYILTAVFASGLSLYGISLIYGTTGTLYFEDIPAGLNSSPLQIIQLKDGKAVFKGKVTDPHWVAFVVVWRLL